MTLGNIGKPTVDQFDGYKKLFLVPFVTSFAQDANLDKLIDKYWDEVEEQITNLESRFGSTSEIFLEGAVVGGETELDELAKANPSSVSLIKSIVSRGAVLRKTEEAEPLLEAVDLQRCLMVTQASLKVHQQLTEWLSDARKRRYSTISSNIDATLGANKVGVLIISQDHQVQFPEDTKVFYIAPPALNQIEGYIRDQSTKKASDIKPEETKTNGPDDLIDN